MIASLKRPYHSRAAAHPAARCTALSGDPGGFLHAIKEAAAAAG
jgi:hypothetical protein